MAVDASRFIEIAPFFHLLWSAPFQLVVGLYFLYKAVGLAFLAGVGVFAVIFVTNAFVSGIYKRIQERQMAKKDTRLKMLGEILNGIRIIKLYAWELAFQRKIERIRNEEVKCLKKAGYLNGVVEIAWSCTNLYACLAIFGAYIASSDDKVLDARNAFVVVTVFNVMYIPLTILPILISHVLMLNVSLGRLGKFLSTDDLKEYLQREESSEFALQLRDAKFAWEKNGADILTDLNLNVKYGQLIAVVGPVGCGKSSLLSAICGEMRKLSGSITVNGTVAYVPQQAWVQNKTVRDNILFAKTFDSIRYQRVIDCCALEHDFSLLPGGDLAEIGERGINLSGGQKQRISLARAVYQNCDVYLLDDPLSAVDVHVGKHIFENVIGPNGLLKDKTRILVTHGLNYLPYCDLVVVVKNGRFQEIGLYRDLVADGGAFAEFLEQYFRQVPDEEIEDLDPATVDTLAESFEVRSLLEKKKHVVRNRRTSSRESLTLSGRMRSLSLSTSFAETNKIEGRLVDEEEVHTEGVPWSVYFMYFKAGGWSFFIHVLFLFFTLMLYLSANVWLELWTDRNYHYSLGLSMYGAAAILTLFTTCAYSIAYVYFQVRASRLLHSKLLRALFRAPTSFFDTTPSGRIINRCGKDVNTIDNQIPMSLTQVATFILLFLQSFAAVVYATPVYVIPFIPTMIFYLLLQKFYVSTSRQLRRLEAKSRSPIYSHFQESIFGAASIRAYHRQSSFSVQSDELVDVNNSAQMVLSTANK